MKAIRALASVVFASLAFSAVLAAQQPVADETTVANSTQAVSASVPRLIRYTGTLTEPSGKPLTGNVEVEFAIYKEQADDTPIWQETQSLELDAQGHYSVLLGVTQPDGLPAGLFGAGMGRWLGVEAAGAAPQPHVLLVAVPYALKAADADALGGKPASAYLVAQPSGEAPSVPASGAAAGTASSTSTQAGSKKNPDDEPAILAGLGTANYISLWTADHFLGNSLLFQSGSNVGIGITTPGAALDTVSAGIGVRGTSTGTTGTIYGVQGNANSTATNAAGVFGYQGAATGQVYGVSGNTGSTGPYAAGVNGYASATTGTVSGVQGTAASGTTGAAGVLGVTTATTGQVYGVSGNASSTTNYAAGVDGFEGAATGLVYGVAGGTNSTTNGATGVNGYEGATTGQVFGVSGLTNSTTQGSAAVTGYEGATTGQVFGVSGLTNSTTQGAAAVTGYEGAATGAVLGVSGGTNSTTNGAAGVNGGEGAATGVVYGVSGGSSSSTANAAGVNGWEGAATGAVFGVNGNTNSTGPGAAAVNGYEGATTGQVFGVNGGTNSATNGAVAVNGFEGATTGQVFGVSGTTTSTQGIGVFGYAAATSGFAVGTQGVTASSGGVGGLFANNSGSGLILQGTSGLSFTTVFKVDASGNGYYAGNLNVTGTLSKGGGSFKIDHPLDPANKYLSHSFVESPDMMNVYNGVIRLDSKGEAWVSLPDYFEALNRDFRYQLTAIGAPAPNLYVAEEVSGNRFKIAGGKPGGKVSWQVTGIRQDAYANAHRIPTEEVKPPAEQGYYLHPELYGQPDSRRVGSAQPATHAQSSGSRDSITSEAQVAISPTR